MRAPNQTKVIVGLSGGVDSSVAAMLLKQQGYQVEAMFMKNWEEDDTREYCSVKQDLEDVRAICKSLDLRLHLVNFAHEYWQEVFSHFLDEYKQGRTPNPDILCNKEIKFKAFLNHAMKLGADYIATGHYARNVPLANGAFGLGEAADTNKDQTYFLYTLGQAQLAKSLFPLGDLTKPQIRALAEEAHLVTHNKKDSTGICFIGERPFDSFLNEYLEGKPGPIKTPDGQTLGEHAGLIFYTLGQRKGLHIGGVKGAENAPWYVVAKDIEANILYVAQGHHPWGYGDELWASQVHWVQGHPPTNHKIQARIRYRQPKQDCTLLLTDQGIKLKFDKPQFAITPGQAVVLYADGLCLGGATIEQSNSPGGILHKKENSLCTP